ncbi:MAG TPA: MBL fold metallo-hydrolase, partial [Myxococcota bacterium]|nr:MBL fold metallo-hydrolase [Myxococcota bacterium]
MKFVLLGTGTLVPDAERGPAGFLVEQGESRILVDGGSGTMQRLARYGVDARSLDAGVYSHWHLDHCGDLAPLLFAMRVGIGGMRREQYPIWAGQGFGEFLGKLEAAFPGWIRSDAFGARVSELSLQGPDQALLPGNIRL